MSETHRGRFSFRHPDLDYSWWFLPTDAEIRELTETVTKHGSIPSFGLSDLIRDDVVEQQEGD